MDIIVGEVSVERKNIIHAVVPHIAGSKSFASGAAAVEVGQVLGENSDGDAIAAAIAEDQDMTGTVDGENDDFTYSAGKALCPGSIVITHGEQEITDDGFGNLQGDGSGTVQYGTGEVAVAFDTAPANGSGAPVIGYADDPEDIALESVNVVAGAEDSGLVFEAGAIIAKDVKVGAAAVPSYIKKRLRLKGIHFIQ